ncbi:LysR substrate-binding domain-containing protein [Sedimenticola sp.]|uniref:LysR substrate-binding domain-containing protein n=1 Tax=Sedimenticola sp. TaxID=1940285 RepID=UPI003D099EE9
MNQRRLLPSTSMLSAFESAARLGSFSRAAVELSLTQGAISRQIRALEEQLDIELFERTPQHVTLTSAGEQYAAEIAPALTIIRTATLNLLSKSGGGELRLAILPTFGAKWLIPRLSDFIEQYPDINVSFTSHVEPFDFSVEHIDAAIHYGQDNWPNADCTFLMNEAVVPVYAPALEEKYRIESHQDFVNIPLLHLSSRKGHWSKWFHINGIEYDASHGILFEQFSAVAQAACAGLGAALIPRLFVDSELKSGALKVFEEGECKSSSSYYLATPKHRNTYLPVESFRKWLLSKVGGHYLS